MSCKFLYTLKAKSFYPIEFFPLFNMAGVEAVGVVTAVGTGVKDVVAYAGRPFGAYAEEEIVPANKLVPVPPTTDPIIGVSILSKA